VGPNLARPAPGDVPDEDSRTRVQDRHVRRRLVYLGISTSRFRHQPLESPHIIDRLDTATTRPARYNTPFRRSGQSTQGTRAFPIMAHRLTISETGH
jgi:hypothetical protein